MNPTPQLPEGTWRPVVGFEGLYWVSDDGRIYSARRSGSRGGIAKLQRAKRGGYPAFCFYKPGRMQTRTIHKVLMEAFVGPCPEGMQVRHLNGNPEDCRLENLAYGTHSENMRDQVAHGTHACAFKTHCPRGHEYTEENIYRSPSRPNARFCWACIRIHQRTYTERRRERTAAAREQAAA